MPPVSFIDVPASTNVPFTFVEIDPTQAQQGPSIQPYAMLVVGQRLAAGNSAENVLQLATSADEVGELHGFGSIIHGMAQRAFQANRFTPTWFIGIDDAAGTAGTQTITIVGTATAAGTINVYIANRRVQVAVASADTATVIAAAIVSAIAASSFASEIPMTAGSVLGVVTLTARNLGTQGNLIDVRLNVNQGETLPAGVTSAAIAAGVTGATDPTLTAAITAMGDKQFHTIAVGLNDTGASSTFSTMGAELLDRFGSVRQLDGQAFYCREDTVGNLTTLGGTVNDHTQSIFAWNLALSPPWEVAAAAAAVVARFGMDDPARPFQTLELPGIGGPVLADQFTLGERDILLGNGLASLKVDDFGVVRIERAVTTFQTNSAGASSTAFRDVNTKLTLSFLRYDFRTQFATRFGRFKLANDGTRFGAGQAIVTPKIATAFAVNIFRQWEDRGLVEGFKQFTRDLVIERDAADPNRLNILLPTDLVNQLRVGGVSFKFLL